MNAIFRLLVPGSSASGDSMDAEIRLVSRFRALMLSRYIVSVALLAFWVVTYCLGLRLASPIYIAATLNLLPLGLEAFLAPYIPKKAVVLPYLRKRYHYNSLRFAANNLTTLLTCFLLLLWQKHLDISPLTNIWLELTPSLLLIFLILFRLIAPFFLTRHISQKLLTGKY